VSKAMTGRKKNSKTLGLKRDRKVCPLISQGPSRNEWKALCSFQFRNEEFFARPRKSRNYAEAYAGTPHK